MSTKTNAGETGQFEQTYRFANFFDSFMDASGQFARSFLYATLATLIALAIAYPLAYAIAFKSGKWKNPLVTTIEDAGSWWKAEEYHQDYLQKHPGGYTCHYLRE
jgi:peptide methionine sulfoxide reductase MsrA